MSTVERESAVLAPVEEAEKQPTKFKAAVTRVLTKVLDRKQSKDDPWAAVLPPAAEGSEPSAKGKPKQNLLDVIKSMMRPNNELAKMAKLSSLVDGDGEVANVTGAVFMTRISKL